MMAYLPQEGHLVGQTKIHPDTKETEREFIPQEARKEY
jgi:hypothetical protein